MKRFLKALLGRKPKECKHRYARLDGTLIWECVYCGKRKKFKDLGFLEQGGS